jgi:hypothetical protein
MCDAPAHAFRFDCPECVRRWEDTECRELRQRLFGEFAELEPLTD